MIDQRPGHGDDDTQRLPTGPADGSHHRYTGAQSPPPPYGRPEHTRFGDFGFWSDDDRDAPHRAESRGAGLHGAEPHRAEPRRAGRPSGGVLAGILAAALVVGGLAGMAGAAGYSAVDDLVGKDPSSTSAAPESSSPVINRDDSAPAADSVEAVAKSVLPSVVKINVMSSQAQGSGSGIIISSDGEILTNNHVAAAAGEGSDLSVSFSDGTTKKATIVGTDPLTDLAVIKAQGVSGLRPATIATSGNVAVGENVVAIGSPFGLEATVTSGIVSALNRPVSVGQSDGDQGPGADGQDTTYPAIQTDAAINPGNSGGPLVDLNGDVVGINSSIRTASSGLESSGGSIGLGFAIPIDNVWPIVQQLRKGETPTHARLGVSVTDAQSSDELLSGAGVQAVNEGSAGAEAGLEEGDVITKVDDQLITGSESLVATVRGYRPGDEVTLTVVTDGRTRTVDVTLDSDEGTSDR